MTADEIDGMLLLRRSREINNKQDSVGGPASEFKCQNPLPERADTLLTCAVRQCRGLVFNETVRA